ncbi:hypothetical protein SAMN05216474_0186 [Lishizhenia tianjinensis]|uniref:Uncharacterized protein n=1 Tax=Lishizhenia tianjinensis TaxID=477690 RepID=A0A1I6XGM9_9FLAO|nr:hypothetical protein [Lishizhenia tianjinensis]SFT37440.1 hypothetical protein SAMN05216474_0186 [Lishizhenia tianjinensis]
MKKTLLAALTLLLTLASVAQEATCFERYEKAFEERGSYTVSDDMHRNVVISFFENGEVYCIQGKARVENGVITSIFFFYDDNTSEMLDRKFYNDNRQAPRITNGISEMITTEDGEKFKVIFIDQLKPKKKKYKEAELPNDL